jgi:transposase
MNDTIFVGLDVHKATVAVAVAEGMRGGEVRKMGPFPHRAGDIAKLAAKLAKGGQRLRFCYEAGPCGYGLYRQLRELGHDCIVVAPSLIPVKSGTASRQTGAMR